MWTNLMFFYYADNLKVSTIVSINFFLEMGQILGEIIKFAPFSNRLALELLALELRICVTFAANFYVERVAVLTMTWSYVRIAVIV